MIPPEGGITVQVAGAVATITLDRPERHNCQDPAMWEWLARVKRALPGTIRVVVLRGAGPSFSSGLDRRMFATDAVGGLAELAGAPAGRTDDMIAAWQDAFDWNSRPDLVSVAAVHGHAIGAGLQLALGADLRVAADDAHFAMAEPTLGLVPDLGGTKRLVDLIGYPRGTELCLTGRAIDAREADRIGLVNTVVPRSDLDAAVARLVAAVCAIDRDAAAETKALLQRAGERSQRDQQAAERSAQRRRLRALAGLEAED